MNLQMLVTNLDLDNMKQLQSNFTTPEQSKRLLELGAPANSADCYYDQYQILNFRTELDYGYDFFELNFRFIPCWSVGRLIEIYNECWCGDFCDEGIFIPQGHIVLQRVLIDFFGAAENGQLDFSKLEE